MNKKVFTVLSLLLVIAFSILIRLPYLSVPLERDEGGYAYIAWGIEHGEIPYRDSFDHKPPLIYFIYLLTFKVFGYSVEAIHFFLILWVLAEVVLIYLLSWQLFHKQSLSLMAAAIFSLMASEPCVFGFTANTEIFMLLPIIGSYILLLKSEEKQSVKWLIPCGLLSGIACMIKPVGVHNFAGIILYLSYQALKAHDLKRLAKQLLYLVSGFILIPALLLFYFWSRRAVPDFIYGTFGYNLVNYMAIGGSLFDLRVLMIFWRRLVFILKSDLLFWLFCLYAFISGFKMDRKKTILLVVWFVMSFLGVSAGKRFFPHYFLQITPPLAIGAAWGLWKLLDQDIKICKSHWLRVILSGALIALSIYIPWQANYRYLFQYTPEQISQSIYGRNPFVEAWQIAGYVATQTSPSDTVAILGSEPEILYYAKRKSASKYIYFYHIFWRIDQTEVLAIQREVVREVENNKPKYIIAVNIVSSVGKPGNAPEYIFDKMRLIIKQDYCLDGFVFLLKDTTIYAFGPEQVKKRQELLGSGQAQIMIYKRNRS
ncbi:MAG: glycosyltransferase family 39 protein [bacterium]|nr:glycosyltransferase family 39 protein [bacterium]MDD5353738.1 glycosyltransferase family 39 protein [bacterium]MDD5755900.1 glycosyltransferase family 39 protein [bacterium]